MPAIKRECLEAQCDACQRVYEMNGSFAHFDSTNELCDTLTDSDWKVDATSSDYFTRDQVHITCPTCLEKRRSDD